MSECAVSISQCELESFCRRHHVQRLGLFGSVLRPDFGPESDIDVLVEFEPRETPGLLAMAGLELELREMFGRTVDLRTSAELSPYFRDEVLKACEWRYVQG
jgi:uncharacterized protein